MTESTTRRRARGLRALAVAALALAALLPAARAACKYKAVGVIPLHWDGTSPIIDGTANDTPVRVLVDTGADNLIMSEALAERLNLSLGHLGHEQAGVGGLSRASRAHLARFTLGKFEWKNAPFLVIHQATDMPDIVIGARFLMQQDVEMTAQALTFFEPSGCGNDTPLGYWAPDVPFLTYSLPTDLDPHLYATVQVNGHPLRAAIDSGATRTVIDVAAARELGVELRAPAGKGGGFGQHVNDFWITRFDSVAVGPEIVRNARLEVEDLWGSAVKDSHSVWAPAWSTQQPQMLLGADFLKAHRVLFAASQGRMYFTYDGGAIFDAPAESDVAPMPVATAASSAAASR
jgi:predicted aspartyl protease